MPIGSSNFTPGAQRVLEMAAEEAQRLNHAAVDTEHLLLGMLQFRHCTATLLLTRRGVDAATIRNAVDTAIRRGSGGPGTPALAPRMQKVIELAAEERRLLRVQFLGKGFPARALFSGKVRQQWRVRRTIGTEHLMLGVVREGEGLAAIVLGTFGITLDWLRTEVARLGPESVEREQ